LCLNKIAGVSYLARNVHPNLFTTLAWDSIPANKPLFPAVQKDKKRSFTLDEDLLPVDVSGKRMGPLSLQSVDLDSSDVIVRHTRRTSCGYLITRQISTKNQQVMEWTGFNIITRKDITIRKVTFQLLMPLQLK